MGLVVTGIASLEGILADIRVAYRTLGRSKLFAAFAILTLSLAIASTTVAYSLVDAVIFPHVPFDHAAQLVEARFVMQLGQYGGYAHVLNAYEIIGSGGKTFEPPAYSGVQRRHLMSAPGVALDVKTLTVSKNYFDVLRVHPQFGRLISGSNSGADQEAVISEGLWNQVLFGFYRVSLLTLAIRNQCFCQRILPRSASTANRSLFAPATKAIS